MALFAGTYENKVDAKGRVSVPAPFRAELEGNAAGVVYIFPSLTGKTLTGCTVDWMEEIKAGMKALPTFSKQRQALTTAIFGRARLLRLDEAGRIVLPRDFAEFAGITGRATFVGMADTFDVWEPARAEAAQAAAVDILLEVGLESILAGDGS